jgi:hypothetical protein
VALTPRHVLERTDPLTEAMRRRLDHSQGHVWRTHSLSQVHVRNFAANSVLNHMKLPQYVG